MSLFQILIIKVYIPVLLLISVTFFVAIERALSSKSELSKLVDLYRNIASINNLIFDVAGIGQELIAQERKEILGDDGQGMFSLFSGRLTEEIKSTYANLQRMDTQN